VTEEYFVNFEALDPADVVKFPRMDALDTTTDGRLLQPRTNFRGPWNRRLHEGRV